MKKSLVLICALAALGSSSVMARTVAIAPARVAPPPVRVAPAPVRVTPTPAPAVPRAAPKPSTSASEASTSYFNWAIPAFLLGSASSNASAEVGREEERKGKK